MEDRKFIDESWKDSVNQEPQDLQNPNHPSQDASSASAELEAFNFLHYISSLALQAMIFLGQIPNPMANEQVQVNLPQARLIIDTLGMLKDKTKGNLTKEEDDFLNAALYELQMKYVELVKKEKLA